MRIVLVQFQSLHGLRTAASASVLVTLECTSVWDSPKVDVCSIGSRDLSQFVLSLVTWVLSAAALLYKCHKAETYTVCMPHVDD